MSESRKRVYVFMYAAKWWSSSSMLIFMTKHKKTIDAAHMLFRWRYEIIRKLQLTQNVITIGQATIYRVCLRLTISLSNFELENFVWHQKHMCGKCNSAWYNEVIMCVQKEYLIISDWTQNSYEKSCTRPLSSCCGLLFSTVIFFVCFVCDWILYLA